MKRLFCLALCLALLAVPALAVAQRPANGYVGDYADVLDDSLEEDIIARNKTLFQNTGAEIVVLSVEFMDGWDAESYAKACFDEWGMGDVERNNGLLLVFATEDRNENGEKRCWAMQGVGLENALSASTLNGWMEDYFYDDFDNGDYNAAVKGFFNAAYSWMERYYAGSADTAPGQTYVPENGREEDSALGTMVVFTLIVFGAVVLLILFTSLPRRRTYGYYTPYSPYTYYRRPFFFWRRWRHGPPPPHRPPNYRPHTGSSHATGFHTGGVSRGGGAGRRGGGSTSFRSSSSHSSTRSGGSFRSGGHSRGGGAGRR